MARHRWWWHAVVAAGLVVTTVSACGDSDDDGAAGEASVPAASSAVDVTEPEDRIVSDEAVSGGFASTLSLMDAASAAGDAVNPGAFDEVHELWESYEGTVKQEDPDTYLTAEEALASFEQAVADKDGSGLQAATDKFRAASETYLAAHPG